jgi:hypothetical protein
MPQGDPASPFMLNLWMKAGNKTVRERLHEGPGRFEKTYMDDRSWTDRDPKRLVQAVVEWQKWSAEMGLKENEEKTQLAGWGVQKTKMLKTAAKRYDLEAKVVQAVEALGAFSGSSLGGKEKDRLESAEVAVKMLQTIPGGRQYKLELARSLALTKATYGWVRKGPPKGKAESLDKQMLKVTKTSKASNPWLRRMMEGGTTTLGIVATQRQLTMVGKRLTQGQLQWSDTTLVKSLRKAMTELGWDEQAQWTWRHGGIEQDISLTSDEEEWKRSKKNRT